MWRLTGSGRTGLLLGLTVAAFTWTAPYWPGILAGVVTAVVVTFYVRRTAGAFFRSPSTFTLLGAGVPTAVALVTVFVAQDLAFAGPLPVLWPIVLVLGAAALMRLVTWVLDARSEVPASCVLSGAAASITMSLVVAALAVAHEGPSSWLALLIGAAVGLVEGFVVSRFLATANF